jgi:hypothetical protein
MNGLRVGMSAPPLMAAARVAFADRPVDPFFNANRPEDFAAAAALLQAAALHPSPQSASGGRGRDLHSGGLMDKQRPYEGLSVTASIAAAASASLLPIASRRAP